ncbi:MAG: glycosyltransferase family 4 protein [Bacteriovorax sp.]
MRIGFEAKRATHNFRGLGNYSRGLIEGLLEYAPDEELLLFTPSLEDQRAIKWVESLSARAQLRLPQGSLKKSFSSFWRIFLMADDLKKEKIDLFHGLSHEIPHRLDSLPFKKVVTMHDLIYLRYPEFFPFIDRIVYSQKFNYACKHSDVVIAICEQTKEDLINFLNVDEKKIVVHYQSCSPRFYEKLPASSIESIKEKYHLNQSFILHVGAFEERKNQLTLLEAFSDIALKIEEDLVFVGQGKAYRAKVESRADELGISHRVHFLNSVSHEELPALYQAAKVFCFPSLFEGFGIPIVEALFSGTPVITSFGSCFPESAGPDSFFVDPLSRSSIAEGLLKVLGDSALSELMAKRGLEFVQRFHRKNSTDHLMEIYRQVTAR